LAENEGKIKATIKEIEEIYDIEKVDEEVETKEETIEEHSRRKDKEDYDEVAFEW